MNPRATRRCVLGWLGAAGLVPAAGRARAEDTSDAFPQAVTLIVAGPQGGGLDGVSQALLPGLQSHLPSGTVVGRDTIGGIDGVTGANQFAAQIGPDGGAALLVPGAASIAWLVGDSRVHFDPSRWLPVLARLSPTVVVGRFGVDAVTPGAHLRVASGAANSPALAALLALDLLGARVSPVYGLDDETAALAALTSGKVDAVLVRDETVIARLGTSGAVPLFSFGVPDPNGADQRETTTQAVPTLLQYQAASGHIPPRGPLYDAWRCAASAAQLRYALVLPTLTPPSAVALWRQAGSHALAPDPDGAAPVLYAAAAAGLMQSLAPDGTALLDLRGWLSARLGWQAG